MLCKINFWFIFNFDPSGVKMGCKQSGIFQPPSPSHIIGLKNSSITNKFTNVRDKNLSEDYKMHPDNYFRNFVISCSWFAKHFV